MSGQAEAALPAFLRVAAAEHTKAIRLHGSTEHGLRVGDAVVRLRFVGQTLGDVLLPALGPRVSARVPDRPTATISLWEETAVSPCAASVPWHDFDLGPRGLLRGPHGSSVLAVHEAPGAATLVDLATRDVYYRVAAAAALPWWERAAPLRPALYWALGDSNRHLVHAGTVGDERGGVLLAGGAGSGKTTTALAAAAAGMRYVADDYVLLETGRTPRAFNLFATAKLDSGLIQHFPGLTDLVTRSARSEPDEKLVLDVPSAWPSALAAELPVRTVLVPSIRGGRTSVRPIRAGEALLALAPSTAMQMPYDNGSILAALAAVVRPLPCFAVDVGDDHHALAGAVDEVLERSTAGRAPAAHTVP